MNITSGTKRTLTSIGRKAADKLREYHNLSESFPAENLRDMPQSTPPKPVGRNVLGKRVKSVSLSDIRESGAFETEHVESSEYHNVTTTTGSTNTQHIGSMKTTSKTVTKVMEVILRDCIYFLSALTLTSILDQRQPRRIQAFPDHIRWP